MTSPQPITRHWLTRLRPLELAEFLKKILRIHRYEIEAEGLRVWIDPVSNVGSRLLAEGTYEKKLTDALSHLLGPNLTFYDVGANEGWFSLIAARIVGPGGRIVAVEPQERLWPVILQNASLNHFANINLQPFAIANQEGETTIKLYPSVNTGASGLGSDKRRFERLQRVTLLPLARLIEGSGLTKIDLMKFDVEGYELEVL
jgi:FkbM family methyltransferase